MVLKHSLVHSEHKSKVCNFTYGKNVKLKVYPVTEVAGPTTLHKLSKCFIYYMHKDR